MPKHLLIAPPFIDPFWFRKMQQGSQEATVIDQQTVEVHGTLLRLAHPEELQLVSSEKAFVTLTRNFYLETEAEQHERLREVRQRQAREQEAMRTHLNQLRDEAKAFNAQIHLPVPWKPGYKAVLSGLSETSIGDGRNRGTVDHIWLHADLDDGRIHRKQWDFLCTSSSKDNGKQWGSPESIAYDGDSQPYAPKVTCQTCLNVAQRWMKRHGLEHRS